ncbi:MAG: hypothetical protein HOI95_05745 [Chromatiales bacterium]|nr:hypothetical protein [Chromatiales bacterium]
MFGDIAEAGALRLLPYGTFYPYLNHPLEAVVPTETGNAEAGRVLVQAGQNVGLTPREIDALALEDCYDSANGREQLFYFNYGRPDIFLIIICGANGYAGHILIDLGAVYGEVIFESPLLGNGLPATEDLISNVLNRARHAAPEDAIAILAAGSSTYLQGSFANGNFMLEHQLVTTRCHYQASREMQLWEVAEVFNAYAHGRFEWASLEWAVDAQWKHTPI